MVMQNIVCMYVVDDLLWIPRLNYLHVADLFRANLFLNVTAKKINIMELT